MAGTSSNSWTKQRSSSGGPFYVEHLSFALPGAEEVYAPGPGPGFTATHMPDEVTRDQARRMHYAAYRLAHALDVWERQQWRAVYFDLRDRIVLGNRKLIYRAVRRWMPPPALADDLAGDCQIVLIQAVAAYNPWLGIRFSTYAFTCLMRALSRLSQRQASDRLYRSLSLDALPNGEPRDLSSEEGAGTRLAHIDEYLRAEHALLSPREKQVLLRRFRLDEQARTGTLEQVGQELGLSKERVRQVQASALDKLRKALAQEASF